MKYIKQLDSIRAIAVIMVIISHWLPSSNFLNRITDNSSGAFGVNVFFVLSGFLITGILLENKKELEESNLNKYAGIKIFFIRRALRIFPIYYLTITFLLVIHKYAQTGLKDNFLYFYTYTANFYFYKRQAWDGMLSHLWSLSVEEQFYLIWPWLIFYFKEKYLKYLIIVFILIGIASAYTFTGGPIEVIITTSCFSAFGIGALLSWQLKFHPASIQKYYKFIQVGGILSSILLLLLINRQQIYVPFQVLCAGVTIWLISYILLNNDKPGIMNFILNNKILINLGKISYGLYLYHLILFMLSWIVVNKLEGRNIFKLPEDYKFALMLWGNAVLLLLISWLSWKYIEKPFLNLKKHFVLDSAKNKSASLL